MIFWSQIGVAILVTSKQEVELKIECFLCREFFSFNFKV